MTEQQPQPCPDCKGAGGHVEDTSDGISVRQNWRTCETCRGQS